jgi:hypothetical protein
MKILSSVPDRYHTRHLCQMATAKQGVQVLTYGFASACGLYEESPPAETPQCEADPRK